MQGGEKEETAAEKNRAARNGAHIGAKNAIRLRLRAYAARRNLPVKPQANLLYNTTARGMSTTTATGARAPLPFISSADVLLPCPGGTFAASLLFFQDVLGFAVASISPADAPTSATLVAYGLRVRLCPPTSSSEPPPTLRLLCSDPAAFGGAPSLVAPNGVRVLLAPEAVAFPVAEGALEDLTVASLDEWVVGRAGMEYRDLIPGRLGGRLIASHIRITRGRARGGLRALPRGAVPNDFCCKGVGGASL